ncbi:uncharacterized protein PAN0_004c2156 [Moesziomyces antarcticus]|uniref:Uncharacterized protein n=1 Tax=Pseudozyma antarctica TaxID=84753 RepID=A0A081CBA1_PSEA2|nr:uncharacterized protein PAN0_004c2156 [Moesziomyces antarcticus]GAK63947.1 hypothetical protein PAN0_004c2156 [Moesziomyces antarcticus]
MGIVPCNTEDDHFPRRQLPEKSGKPSWNPHSLPASARQGSRFGGTPRSSSAPPPFKSDKRQSSEAWLASDASRLPSLNSLPFPPQSRPPFRTASTSPFCAPPFLVLSYPLHRSSPLVLQLVKPGSTAVGTDLATQQPSPTSAPLWLVVLLLGLSNPPDTSAVSFYLTLASRKHRGHSSGISQALAFAYPDSSRGAPLVLILRSRGRERLEEIFQATAERMDFFTNRLQDGRGGNTVVVYKISVEKAPFALARATLLVPGCLLVTCTRPDPACAGHPHFAWSACLLVVRTSKAAYTPASHSPQALRL